MAETDGDREAVVMGRSAVTREVEVEATVENVTVVAADAVTVVVIRGVVVQSTVQVGRSRGCVLSEGPHQFHIGVDTNERFVCFLRGYWQELLE